MGRFVVRRLLQIIPIFFGVTFLVYFLVSALGSPLDTLSPQQKRNPAYLEFLTEQFNLNDPFIVQYLKYIGNVFTGDLGTTFAGESVTEIVITRMPVTATLAGTALVIELVLGIVIGVIAARRRGKLFDNASLVIALIFIAIPVFVLAFVMQWLFGIKLGWVVPTGVSEGWPLSYIVPAFVLAAGSLAYVIRITRQSLLETLNTDFIRTARAKGLPAGTILRRYGLRNSLIPVVVFLGLDIGALMTGAVVTEGIFNVPGIGQQLFTSIKQQEAVVIVGIVTLFVIIFQLLNLLVDVISAALDPRIRYE
ncbi:MAG: ABC transporter permease [Micrococcales bacterium]|nr:ABC transporter permease [Micrococcales bacterium]